MALPRRQIKLAGIYVARLLLDKSQQQQPLTSSAASGTIQNVVFRIFSLMLMIIVCTNIIAE